MSQRVQVMTIKAQGVAVTINGHRIFSGIDAELTPGTVTALVGPSGSGKSTLLNCIGLLLNVSEGQVLVDDQDTTGWKDAKKQRFWRQDAAFIFQDYGLIDEQTVAYNVTMHPIPWWRRTPKATPELEHVLKEVGLQGRGLDRVSVLSGGERQRVGIARALYKNARYIFADEPTASLDRKNRDTITALLTRASHNGAAVVVATHDEALIAAIDQKIVLDHGA